MPLNRRQSSLPEAMEAEAAVVSFNLMEKIAAFGACTLVPVSLATTRPRERARAPDTTLAGIARRDSMTAFDEIERLLQQEVVS